MALRFRRGLDIERQAVVFVEGEPTYTTDNKEFFIGDGVTPGGIQIGGLNNLIDDTTPRLGGDLDLNNHNLVGSGDIHINGDLKITGSIDVGLITANYTGSLFADDSSLIVDAINRQVYADIMAIDGTVLIDTVSKEFDLSSTSLESLRDVVYDNQSPGGILTWNGSQFSLSQLGSTPGSIVQDKQLLQYDVAAGWVASDNITMSDSSVLIDIQSGVINLNNTTLDSHLDVLNNNLTVDDVLAWDGVNWVNKQLTIDNADITIAELDDVVISPLLINDVLAWDGVNWTNQPQAQDLSVEDLNNVFIDQVQTNDVLSWNGADWVNLPNSSTDELADIANVEFDQLQINDVLAWDGVNWINRVQITEQLNEIADVLIFNLATNDVLAWDGVNWINRQETVRGINDLDNAFIDTDSLEVDDVLTWNGSAWVNQPFTLINTLITGSLQGDLLGDDSRLVFDSVNNALDVVTAEITNITANIGIIAECSVDELITDQITSSNRTLRLVGPANEAFQVLAFSDENHATVKCMRSSVNDLSSDIGVNGRLIFSRNDTTNGELSTGLIYSSNDYIRLSSSAGGTFTPAETIHLENAGGSLKVGIGTVTPAETLHVAGSGKYDSFIQFGSLSTVERDALTPANGMVIYNTTVDKFQGYAGGAWVDLS